MIGAEAVEEEVEDPETKVPKVSLDYFFLGNSRKRPATNSTKAMTTKELRKKLKTAQLPSNGGRHELERRYNDFKKETLAEAGMSFSEEEGGVAEEDGDTADPSLVMIDQAHGNRYMRVVDQHGLGETGEM